MLELLPNNQKKSLKREYLLRLSVLALLFLMLLGILFLVSLLPSYFLSITKEDVVSREFEKAQKSNVTEEKEDLQFSIKNSKEMLALLKPPSRVISVKDLTMKIIDKKGLGIMIDGISVNYAKNGQYQISLKGKAKNRDILKSFSDNLRADKDFSDIDLPISNFTKVSDIDFTIIIKTTI